MSHFRTILNFCLVMLFTGQISAQEARLLRFPAIHDQQVVFTYAGDLYTVPLSGGMARKLTSHVGFEMFARFSPDGKTIAFTGQYDGNTEVFTIPSQGGVPQRLTHTATLSRDDLSDRMGPNNIVMTWTPDGKNVVYRSRKQTFNDFVGHLFSVPAEGGLSQELPLSTGGFCSYSPDGKKLAFNRVFREFRTWKYYHGGMADDIWIFNFDTKEVKNITNNIAQDILPMWIGNEIFFLSDRDRTMNLFSYNLETEKVEKVTHFDDFDIKFPSHGGNSIVFEKGGYLFHFDASTREVKQIPVTIATDNQYSRSEYKDASKRIFSSGLAPDGSRVVFSARGDIFTVPAESGITRNLTRSSGAHDRNATWSPDGKHIAYVSDASGEYEIYIQPQDGSGAPIQLTQNGKTYIFGISWSPDSKKIAWSSRDGKLQYIDVQSKKVTQVEKGEYDISFSSNWSPDSKWLTYTMQDENRFAVVYIYNLATGEKHPVTDSWYSSAQPSFSSDGKYLLFTSDRDFNPIYSRTEWNHAYSSMSRIYMVMLAKDTPSPFAPE
ncbi:MAG: protease, partial [Rikenellaceae bacterium]|nr:protease [Rikenellaceae bacterium]